MPLPKCLTALRPEGSRLWGKSLLIFLMTTLLYFILRSRSLDEWDSVQFALGVRSFNLFAHTPHPPGYPLYIYAGRVLHGLLGLEIPTALLLVSAAGGGLFVAAWFLLIARRFEERLAWLTALSLLVLPAMWMTATKVLTDAPASGLMALQLVCLLGWQARRTRGALALAALCGAAAAGCRPQNFAVILLVLVTGLALKHATRREWLTGLGLLVAGSLAWLIPTLWSQASLPEAHGSLLAYPRQLLAQWRWRFNKPDAYVGAGDGSPHYLALRLYRHFIKAWFSLGCGWVFDRWYGSLGLLTLVAGWGLYLWRGIWKDETHRAFWRLHRIWAPLYVAMIFIALPPTARYYIPIYPLLLFPALAGYWSLRRPYHWAAAALPALLLIALAPYVGDNHTDEAPPIRMFRHLERLHPAPERARVWLYLQDSQRHGQWYGQEFHLAPVPSQPRAGSDRDENYVFAQARAIYTEDKDFAKHIGWRDVRLRKIKRFRRSDVIHNKHFTVTLYRVRRRPPPPPSGSNATKTTPRKPIRYP